MSNAQGRRGELAMTWGDSAAAVELLASLALLLVSFLLLRSSHKHEGFLKRLDESTRKFRESMERIEYVTRLRQLDENEAALRFVFRVVGGSIMDVAWAEQALMQSGNVTYLAGLRRESAIAEAVRLSYFAPVFGAGLQHDLASFQSAYLSMVNEVEQGDSPPEAKAERLRQWQHSCQEILRALGPRIDGLQAAKRDVQKERSEREDGRGAPE